MKTTPLDKLVYTTARLSNDFVVFKQFSDLLKTTTPTVIEFKDWNYDWTSPVLPKVPAKLWGQGTALCVFSARSIVPGTYNCSVSADAQGHGQELFIADLPCYLDSVLLFKRSDTSFDVIPLMSVVAADGVFPEFQLRFDWQEDVQRWGCQVSPTGFVNAYVYWPTVSPMTAEDKAAVEAKLEWLANAILRYLGALEALLTSEGKWEIFAPKSARVVHDKQGRIKKIYKLGQMGYRHYIVNKSRT